MGVFTWRLPDLLAEDGIHWKMRDNPGSAYFQALAETGAVGLLVTLLFLAALARDAARRVASGIGDAAGDACALGVLAFTGVLAVGSHWLAPDTGLFFFLAAAVASVPRAARPFPPRPWLWAAAAVYAAGALWAGAATASPEAAFRYGDRLGFYPEERGPGGRFQWTRKNFALEMPPRRRVRLALGNFTPLGRPVDLVARSGGRVLYRRTLAAGEIVPLRVSGGGKRAVVTFSASHAFVPRSLGIRGGDRRQLALQAVFLPPR